MLDPWVIEEIMKQEQLRREQDQFQQLELEIPRELDRPPIKEERPSRGVVIIDI